MNGAFGMSEIEKIGAQAYSIPKSEQEQRARATTARTQMNALQDLPEDVILGSRALTRIAKNAPNTVISAEQRVRSSVESRLERSNTQAMNAIGREYSESNIGSMARGMYNQSGSQNQALSMMNMSYDALNERRASLGGQINALGASSSEAAGNLFAKRGPRGDMLNQIGANAQQAGGLVAQMASVELAMKTKRQTGDDPLSRFEKLNSIGGRADDLLSARGIGQELSQGGVNISRGGAATKVATGDIGSALAQEASALKTALSELANSAGASSEKLEELRSKAEESAENFDKLSKAQNAAGGGGASTAQIAAAGAGMFNAVGSGIQQIGVGQRLGQMGNIGGLAGIENQKYDMYKSGRGGNVLNQMLSTQWSDAEGFGSELKDAQNAATDAFALGGVAQTTAGLAQIGEGSAQKLNPGAYITGNSTNNTNTAIQGMVNTTQGATTTAVAVADRLRGVSAGQTTIQGTQADMAARKELLAVQAEQLQGFRDYSVGMSTAAMGMGKRGGAFLGEATSQSGIQKMVNASISPEQMSVISQQGVAAMGSMFNQDQIFAARGLERSGMGSMGENMSRMASLAGAGANNPQAGLGSVMEAAVSKGVDSSKAMTMMVENTAAMVAATGASTAAGINTVGATATLLGGSIDPNQKNQEFAVQRARAAQEVAKDTVTDTSVSFEGMVNTSRISKTTGLKGSSSIFAAGLTPAEIRGLQEMKDPAKQTEALLKRGVNVSGLPGGVSTFLDTMLQNQTSQMFTGNAGLALGGNKVRESITAKALSGKGYSSLTTEEKEFAGQLGAKTGLSGDEYYASAAGLKNAKNAPNAATDVKSGMAGEGGSKELQEIDKLRVAGAKQLAEQTLEATKIMGGALKNLTAMNDRLEKEGASGAEGKFKDAAATSAETFGKSTFQFEKAVTAFDKAIRETMGKAGMNNDAAAAAQAQAEKMAAAKQNALSHRVSGESEH